MSSQAHCKFSDAINDYLSGQMPDDAALAFESHINNCPACLALIAVQTRDSAEEHWLQILRNPSSRDTDSHAITINHGQPTLPLRTETSTATPPSVSGLRYTRTRRIGFGGSGEVWEAWDQLLNRSVAIKILRSSAPSFHESQRLLQEASALARLAHPHIVGLHEVEDVGGQPALIMEFVSGPSLAVWLRGQPSTPTAAARLLQQLCQAVDYAHTQGVLHRDLKPSNILLKPLLAAQVSSDCGRSNLECWSPKIADFGLARLIDQPHLTLSGQLLGTPSYMAPEQVLPGRSNTAAAPTVDVYGLGAVLYELLTGRPPFISSDPALTIAMILREDPVSPRALVPAIPRDLETICLKCLSREPRKRYPSAAALLADIDAFLENCPISARPISRPQRVFCWCRRHPAEAVAAAATTTLALALIFGSLWYASIQKQRSHEANEQANLNEKLYASQQQEQEAVRAGFDRLMQFQFLLKAMIEDERARQEGGLRVIRDFSLRSGGEVALDYLRAIEQNLQSAQTLSVAQIRTAIDCLIMATQAGVSSEFEPRIETLRQRVAQLTADACDKNARLEMEIRICNLQAGCFTKNQQHTLAGDTYGMMASLIHQQALSQPPANRYRLERLALQTGMLMNARSQYLEDNRSDLALKALQQAEQATQLLIHEDPQNLDRLSLHLEVRLALARLLPPEQAKPLAREAIQTLTKTQWNSPANADKARLLKEQFQTLIP
jgi:serine/threonine protein kinase